MIQRPPSSPLLLCPSIFRFFFNDTATTEIYTLSLHDALPISFLGPLEAAEVDDDRRLFRHLGQRRFLLWRRRRGDRWHRDQQCESADRQTPREDRKSTRLNSSHT